MDALKLLVLLLAMGVAAPAADDLRPAGADAGLHAPFDRLLRSFVSGGVVRYDGFKQHDDLLDEYLLTLAATDPAKLEADVRKALWINAYNAFTIKLMLRRYPGIKSIKDIPDRWDLEEWYVGGKLYSLNAIEHEILRKLGDPRIHAAIVCASKSCPDLRAEAYVAGRLDAQLTDALKTFLANAGKGFVAQREKGTVWGQNNNVYLSSIFKWFAEDFERAGGSVLGYLKPYLPDEGRAFLERHGQDIAIRYLDYDWTINGR